MATDLVGAKGLDFLHWSSRRMLRMPEEEDRGGRYITMEGGGELRVNWIDEKRREWVDCERKATARKQRNCVRARGKGKGEGVGYKQLDWILDLAQPRGFEFDPKLDR